MTQKFFHFVIANPIVLIVVQHRNEHVKMRQKLLQRQSRIQFDMEIRAFSPVGKLLIQRQPPRGDSVAKRLEHFSQKILATTTWQCGKHHT